MAEGNAPGHMEENYFNNGTVTDIIISKSQQAAISTNV